MPEATQTPSGDHARIMLGLLDSVERDGAQSQRRLASELGIALGLVNAYLKKCVSKGLVKASQAPARRYVYYLTPRGFAEKSRLTVEYLSSSFEFFRHAKTDCAALFHEAQNRGYGRVVLAGKSDLAEIATICALETGTAIDAIVDAQGANVRFMGLPVVPSYADLTKKPDAIIVTDLLAPQEACERAIERIGAERVLVPSLLRVRLRQNAEAVA